MSDATLTSKPKHTFSPAQLREKAQWIEGQFSDTADMLRWAADQLEGYYAWERSVHEALNSGDGSYRP